MIPVFVSSDQLNVPAMSYHATAQLLLRLLCFRRALIAECTMDGTNLHSTADHLTRVALLTKLSFRLAYISLGPTDPRESHQLAHAAMLAWTHLSRCHPQSSYTCIESGRCKMCILPLPLLPRSHSPSSFFLSFLLPPLLIVLPLLLPHLQMLYSHTPVQSGHQSCTSSVS